MQGINIQKNLAFSPCKKASCTLAFLWLAGFGAGFLFSRCASDTLLALMRQAPLCPVSIVWRLVYNALPFLIAAFAVSISSDKLLYALCWIKVFLFSSFAFSTVAAFGSAAWLVRLLLQFSDLCLLPVLYWFARRSLGKGRQARDLSICLALASLVGVVDQTCIAPFLMAIIEQ